MTSYIIRIRSSSYFLAVLPLAFLGVSFCPHLIETASAATMETLPMEKAAPAAVAIEITGSEAELRRLMRVKNGVTELKASTDRFSEAPMGSYGFITPSRLGLALVTQSPDLVLERVASATNNYEIHKLSDGSGVLVGFVGKELLSEITPVERPKNVRISLYSNFWDKAPFIVAVPVTKLMVDRMPAYTDRRKPESPVVLEMDLQSTANRKSPVGR